MRIVFLMRIVPMCYLRSTPKRCFPSTPFFKNTLQNFSIVFQKATADFSNTGCSFFKYQMHLAKFQEIKKPTALGEPSAKQNQRTTCYQYTLIQIPRQWLSQLQLYIFQPTCLLDLTDTHNLSPRAFYR